MSKEREQELLNRIDRCQRVLNGIRDNEAIKIIFEDLSRTKEMIDANWHLCSEEAKLQELRVTKLAIASVLNLVQNYEHDYSKATEELEVVRNKSSNIQKDYDSEGV